MVGRIPFWIAYAALLLGVDFGIARLLHNGPGTFLVILGLFWIFSGLPSRPWWFGPEWPWPSHPLAAWPGFGLLLGAVMIVTGVVYHVTDSIFIAGVVFLLSPGLMVILLLAGKDLLHPWSIPTKRREAREARRAAVEREVVRRVPARQEWKLPHDSSRKP